MHHKRLLKLRNVLGVSPGADKWNDDKVTVFVQVKHKPETILSRIADPDDPFTKKDVIPKRVRVGLRMVETKVVSIGPVVAQLDVMPDRDRYNPVQPGCEIGERGINFVGTLGMVVFYREFQNKAFLGRGGSFIRLLEHFGFKVDRKPGFLTNCHVTQQDVTKPKLTSMCQPGVDGYAIGDTMYSVPLIPGKQNSVDASIIKADREYLSQIIGVGTITGVKDVEVGDKVRKYGRTTRLTDGTCVAIGVTLSVDYGLYSITFGGLDMYSCMSDHGDSGSIIVDEEGRAVSLLFAGSNTATFGIPLRKVLSTLAVEL